MPTDRQLDGGRRRRIRYAQRKLKEAQQRLARAQRSILHWSLIPADLRCEHTRAIQPPLWPEDQNKEEK
jgi:hypothetical protein